MQAKRSTRRRFLKDTAALTALAAGGTGTAAAQTPAPVPDSEARRAYGVRSRYETAARQDTHTPLQDLTGIITPPALHFVVRGYPTPDIDPRQHRLMIHGMVDRPLIFTLDELKRLPSVSRVHFLECAGNSSPVEKVGAETVQETHGWTSCSEWTGVQLSLLLKEAGIQSGGKWIVAEGAEPPRHTKSIPIEKAMEDCLVAYGQNGEAVRPENGYPLRLVVPGFEGISNVKWLRRIKVVDQPYMAMRESTAYVVLRPNLEGKAVWFNFEMGPKSVITRPSGGQHLPGPGFYEITGLAWSAGGAVRRVEVSTDGGRTWKDAELQGPIHRIAHTRFRLPWVWNGDEVMLQSRCTDERGGVQPSLAEMASMYGESPSYFSTTKKRINHWNAIQPWKVTRDGKVHNALLA